MLPSEYENLLDYLDGFTRTRPALLKDSPSVDSAEAEKLKSFMETKGITASIPITSMCKADFDRMYGYVISQGQTPDCIKAPAKDYTDDFLASIQKEGITEKKQLLLLQLRSQAKELLALGVNPADTDSMLSSIGEFHSHYDTLDADRARLSGEYKSLLTLRQHLTYAESPSFLYGSLFNEKVHEAPAVVEKPEKDLKPQKHFDMDFEL